jgi:hypothetical protein
MKHAYIFMLFFIIIFIMYLFFDRANSAYFRHKLNKNYARLSSNAVNENAQNVVKNGESIPLKTVMDHYRIGSTYLLHFKDKERAYSHFRSAINRLAPPQVARKGTLKAATTGDEIKDNIYVLGRIEDMRDLMPEIRNLPLQRALLRQYNERKTIAKSGAPQKIKDLMTWRSDSQNVHDVNIMSDFAKQYIEVLNDPKTLYLAKDMNILYDQAIKWIRNRYIHDKERTEKIDKVISTLEMNFPVHILPPGMKAREKDIISCVWLRALHPDNIKNSEEIKTALADSVVDCVEGQNVVCSGGRAPKLWQSLANIDYVPHLGIFKTKQAIKNEIYERAAKIRANNEKEINKGELAAAKQNILSLKSEYIGKISEAELDSILQECCDNI